MLFADFIVLVNRLNGRNSLRCQKSFICRVSKNSWTTNLSMCKHAKCTVFWRSKVLHRFSYGKSHMHQLGLSWFDFATLVFRILDRVAVTLFHSICVKWKRCRNIIFGRSLYSTVFNSIVTKGSNKMMCFHYKYQHSSYFLKTEKLWR